MVVMVVVMVVMMVVIVIMLMVMRVVMVIMIVVMFMIMCMIMVMMMVMMMLMVVVMMMFMFVVMLMLVMMLMVMIMLVFVHILGNLFLPVHAHRHMRSLNTAPRNRLRPHRYAVQSERVHLFHVRRALPVIQQLVQRRVQHVTRGTHAAIDIQTLHDPLPPVWLIIDARYPAPKPLSILTTETPDAQELSIDSSADNPPNDAP